MAGGAESGDEYLVARAHPMEGNVTELAGHGQDIGLEQSAPNSPLASRHASAARLRRAYAAIPPGSRSGWPSPPRTCSGSAIRRRGSSRSTCRRSAACCASTRSRTAIVGGMTTYEDLADATLRHGLMPLVVPQLKTITLGGAVSGPGDRVHLAAQRDAARVGDRDGDPDRRRPGGHRGARRRARRAVPGLSRTRTGRSATRSR